MKPKKVFQFSLLSILIFGLLNGLSAKDKTIENFTLTDYNGKTHSLSDYQNSKAIVVMFIATQCPVSNAYNARMAKLYEEYQPKGIAFLGINSNKQESIDEIKAHAEQNKFGFPVLKDVNNVIADKFGASFTPEVYVLSPKFEILYHGRIDDSRREEEVKSRDLRKALDEILAGKKVHVPETKAFGCTIKRVNQ
ncbi:MAG: thioredoxin family protein [candidate division KSB1 bacterium]|nr:thioredoxin family protein [candidate division KSB1 bacterium]MDZ7336051.1 thioredoxin family protein [candidate division KSB1 bacterium]MDZ7358061.1 thioredoxin family protein [candidate division KSB1 bacterium]MDZ7402236.1 thioredoxin family protein [candidate division KSB1 bacterium]